MMPIRQSNTLKLEAAEIVCADNARQSRPGGFHKTLCLQGNCAPARDYRANPCICCIAALTSQSIVHLQHLPIFSLKQAPDNIGALEKIGIRTWHSLLRKRH